MVHLLSIAVRKGNRVRKNITDVSFAATKKTHVTDEHPHKPLCFRFIVRRVLLHRILNV